MCEITIRLIQSFMSKGKILTMNDFCIKSCLLGKKKSQEFLDKNNSVYDAAMDMCFFC